MYIPQTADRRPQTADSLLQPNVLRAAHHLMELSEVIGLCRVFGQKRNANEPLNTPNNEVDRPESKGHGFVKGTNSFTTTVLLLLRDFTHRAYQVANVKCSVYGS